MTSNQNLYIGDFLESVYGHPWTIPKTISKIITLGCKRDIMNQRDYWKKILHVYFAKRNFFI
jgi:hypothetical protein